MLKKIIVLLNLFIMISLPSLKAEETINDLMVKATQFAEEERYGEAIKQYETVLEREPKNVKALLLTGLAYANLNKPEEAVRYTKKAAELDPSYTAYYNLGLIYAANNQPVKALEAFDQALALNPTSYMAEYQKGITYSIQKDYESAARAFQRSIELNPDFEDAHIGLVGSTYKKGDKAQAETYIEELRKSQKSVLAEKLENWIKEKETGA